MLVKLAIFQSEIWFIRHILTALNSFPLNFIEFGTGSLSPTEIRFYKTVQLDVGSMLRLTAKLMIKLFLYKLEITAEGDRHIR